MLITVQDLKETTDGSRTQRPEQMSFEEYVALVEQDPEHAYEYLVGHVYMMTGGSPDYSIIGSNLNGLLQAFLRGRAALFIIQMSICNYLSITVPVPM